MGIHPPLLALCEEYPPVNHAVCHLTYYWTWSVSILEQKQNKIHPHPKNKTRGVGTLYSTHRYFLWDSERNVIIARCFLLHHDFYNLYKFIEGIFVVTHATFKFCFHATLTWQRQGYVMVTGTHDMCNTSIIATPFHRFIIQILANMTYSDIPFDSNFNYVTRWYVS